MLAAAGCGSKAGMQCQQQSDCRSGLVCSKAPGASVLAFGICEPARRGLGESCQRSIECQAGLRCSTERGHVPGDGWFGVCEPAPDMATADLSMPDLLPTDGGADLKPDL
ncbi:MAG: hypothetical protein U1A78_06405 [Polyangia bacterium]